MPLGPRPTPVVANSPVAWVPGEDDLHVLYPLLIEYLTCTQWDSGETRQTATMLLFFEQNLLKCCFNDRDLKRRCFVSASSLSVLLSKLDRGIETGDLDWREDRPPGRTRPPENGKR